MQVAVINCGSSSIKYEVFEAEGFARVAEGLVEGIGGGEGRFTQRQRQPDGSYREHRVSRSVADHRQGFGLMRSANLGDRVIPDERELVGIGHRVVHGGRRFERPVVIDDEVMAAIRDLIPLAPLHNPPNLLGIEVSRELFPGVPQVAVFDTAFHMTLPAAAYHYAVPARLYAEHHVRRYGFHGTSHQYVSRVAAKHLGKLLGEVNLITLHLGNGASVAAVRGGRSVDTSMGLTPLEGLMMGTRCGDLDPAIHFYLMRQAGMSPEELEKLLNHESGLKGMCGTNDMREIEERIAAGDEHARLAFEMFCYRVRKYIGAYSAVLGRVDALVFTGGIGENSAPVRSRTCEGLDSLGIRLDARKNETVSGPVAEIQGPGGRVRVLMIRTDEQLEIARQTLETIRAWGDP